MPRDPKKVIWLLHAPEEKLALLQQNQGRSNNCAEFAAAAALNLLFDLRIDGLELAELADRGWFWKGLRAWPGGPTAPAQQVRLVREAARQNELALEVSARKASLPDLRRWLGNPRLACLVTLAWDNRRPLKMSKAAGAVTAARSPFFWSGHTMLLAAYRPGPQRSLDRWGLVNSWSDPGAGAGIYWMENAEFERCWGYWLFPIGAHNVVVIEKVLTTKYTKNSKTTKREV